MQVFVYEFITGGGLWSLGDAPPSGSLLAEGEAMAAAIAADFRAAGVQVCLLRDARLGMAPGSDAVPIASAREEQSHFAPLAAASDWTLVIAPETAGALGQRCQWVSQCGGRLLSPPAELIALAGDKCRTADHLRQHGIPASDGIRVEPDGTAPFPGDLFPAILKPIDGCGSQDIRLLADAAEATAVSQPMRLERFIPGRAASVAVLCGPSCCVPLAACEQRLSQDGRFTYLGGRLPLPNNLDRRARQLAVAAVKTLPAPLGYIGVDLVLGDAADSSGDCVIELNPRLTTSYVGLRALCADNLAAAMMAVASGAEPSLSWRGSFVEFAADGRVTTSRCESQGDWAR